MNKDFLSLFYRKLNTSFKFFIELGNNIDFPIYCNRLHTFFLYRYIDSIDNTQNLASKLSFRNHIKKKMAYIKYKTETF